MSRISCPDVRNLEALLSGDGIDFEPDEVVGHLETCVDCQRTLENLAADPAVWEDAVHGLGGAGNQELALRCLIERLKQDDPSPADDLSFLRPASKPGLLGMLGPYEVLQVIGRGGMGVVLKAQDIALNRVVAVKVISPFLAGSADSRRRFKREVQAAAAVCHEHVVTVHSVDETEGVPYLVMQFVPGESLQDRLDRIGALEPEEIVRIGLQTASGLAAAHARGLIHRDIKPANLLLSCSGDAKSSELVVKITDFGLARTADNVGLTRDGVLAGTPEYMAPEQARGDTVDHRADLFSLGSVLYAMCAGCSPFRGPNAVAVLRRVSDEEPAPIRMLNPAVPIWLEAIISRLMAKDPGKRFQSAVEVAALLKAYLAHLRQPDVVSAPRLPSPLEKGGIEHTKRTRYGGAMLLFPRRLMLVAVAFVAALAAGIFLAFAGAGVGANPKTDFAQEFFESFKGQPKDAEALRWMGTDAQRCVKYEPDGLRITLPSGVAGERPNTGLSADLVVKGDFEVTVGFEILKEPDKDNVGRIATRLTLEVLLDSPAYNVATISRAVDAGSGQSTFVAWRSLGSEEGNKPIESVDIFATKSKTGRLRLVRNGSDLSFFAAEGDNPQFRFLKKYRFSDADLKEIHLIGSTGDARAELDARFTDLRVSYKALANLPESRSTGAESRGSKGWLAAGVILSLLTLVLVVLSVGVWLFIRKRSGFSGYVTPVVCLVFGLLFAALGIAAPSWFRRGDDPPLPVRENSKTTPSRGPVAFDFRTGIDNMPALTLDGPDIDTLTKTDDRGLRVTIPAGQQDTRPITVECEYRLRGDFDVALDFELIEVGNPLPQYGAGVRLRLWFDEPGSPTAIMSRFRSPKTGEIFAAHKTVEAPDGSDRYVENAVEKTINSKAKMRLVRKGSRLDYLVADAGQDFKRILSVRIGTGDVRKVRVSCLTMYTPIALDVRLHELAIDAEAYPNGMPSDRSQAAASEASRFQEANTWWTAAAFFVLSVVLFVATGAWLLIRQSRWPGRKQGCAAVPDEPAESAPVASALSSGARLFNRRRRGFPEYITPIVCLAFGVLFATLALVAPNWFSRGDDPPPLVSGKTDAIPSRGPLAFDFRAGIDNLPPLFLDGPNFDTLTKTDDRGLRVTIPAGQSDTRPITVDCERRLRGDFDVVLGYELIEVGNPLPQYGAGVVMRLWFDEPGSPTAMLSRFRKPILGETFSAHRTVVAPDGKDQYLNNVDVVANESKGKLRLVRKGGQLNYLVADARTDFKRIQSVQIGTGDVQKVRVSCSTMHTPIALDVRLTELVIDAEAYPDGMPSAKTVAASVEASRTPETNGGWTAPFFAVLSLVSFGAVGAWFLLHKTPREGREHGDDDSPDKKGESASVASAIVFPCFNCAQRLKARSELAGKMVKCPHCGKAVAVPAIA